MITAKKKAEDLFISCWPELDNGNFVKGCWAKKYARLMCEEIIKEFSTEYTNDENHDRIIFWKDVIKEVDAIKL